MAKTLYSQSGKIEYGIKKYTVDTEADKEALNLRTTKMGSKCYVMDTKKWYILNSSNQWIPFVGEGGSVNAEVILAIIDEMSDSEKSQLKSELDITSVFTFKGVVNEENDLPLNNNSVGDVYHVIENSSEYIWVITNNIGDFEIGKWEMLGNDFIEITPTNIITATEQMTATQKATTRENIGAGTYSKPNHGIPKSDLTLTIQTSLNKADTALQTAPVISVNGKTGAVGLSANDVGALPNDTPIPSAVTEQTVSGWGFTKNTGTYSKPSGGIPKSDLSSAVQTSLGKADTALQAAPVTSVNGKTGAVVLNAEDVGGSVTPESIVTATEQMNDAQKSQTRDNLGAVSMDDVNFAIADAEARTIVPMAVDGGNLALNLKQWGGIQSFVEAYSLGMNLIFALPMPYLDQSADDNDGIVMQLIGSDTENGVFHFEGIRGGKRYYARMTPISANVLSGPLVIRDELPPVTTADNGSILRVVNGNWTAQTVPSAEFNSFGGGA